MTYCCVYRSMPHLALTREASRCNRRELTQRLTTGQCAESERLGGTQPYIGCHHESPPSRLRHLPVRELLSRKRRQQVCESQKGWTSQENRHSRTDDHMSSQRLWRAWTGPAQVQARRGPSTERSGQSPNLNKELFAIDTYRSYAQEYLANTKNNSIVCLFVWGGVWVPFWHFLSYLLFVYFLILILTFLCFCVCFDREGEQENIRLCG